MIFLNGCDDQETFLNNFSFLLRRKSLQRLLIVVIIHLFFTIQAEFPLLYHNVIVPF